MLDDLAAWAATNGVRIGLVLALAVVLLAVARRAIPRAVALALAEDPARGAEPLSPEERRRRIDTVAGVLGRTAAVLVVVVAAFLVLGEVGLNLGPLLAGAGIAGIAIGFGAQAVVRDALAGIFILLENQYGRGDLVEVAGVRGIVEDLSLRRTILRDEEGTVHTVPNGEIKVSSNLTRGRPPA